MIGMADPTDLMVIDDLQRILKKPVLPAFVQEDELLSILDNVYRRQEQMASIAGELAGELQSSDFDINAIVSSSDTSEAPVVRLLQSLFEDAVQVKASDVHIEPEESQLRIRLRVDGELQEQIMKEKRVASALVSRLKIMSGLDISEKRLPQDGRFNIRVRNRNIDVRLSTMPVQFGESVVMRLLDQSGGILSMASLGMKDQIRKRFEYLITRPHGLILVTGPTGSGKTTTLYAALTQLNQAEKKIITAEDPIEYRLPRINQVQVNTAVDLTFANALRSMLRQAPNVVMLGEIRDYETASIAINASLTGHLVFSTLHTNDAPSAVTRLTDIGVKPFLIASATRCLMAQRLVRKICPKCETPTEPEKSELLALGLDPDNIKDPNFLAGKGCDKCNGTGHKGRFGLFEVFVVDDESRKMIVNKVTTTDLRRRAREVGMRTLREDGARKAVAGMTTANEVLRVTVGDEN